MSERRRMILDDLYDGKVVIMSGDPRRPSTPWGLLPAPEIEGTLRAAAERATLFDISRVASYYYEVSDRDVWEDSQFPCVAPPFPVMWMEWDWPHWIRTEKGVVQSGNGGSRALTLVQAITVGQYEEASQQLGAGGGPHKRIMAYYHAARWLLSFQHFTCVRPQGETRLISLPCSWTVAIGDDGGIVTDSWSKLLDMSYAEVTPRTFLDPALLALSFLNTVNRQVREVEAPIALNRKRAKRGRRELVTYSEIVVPGHTPAAAGTSGYSQGPKGLHVVRGHFKKRATGVFWWHPHIRGKYEEGVTISSYKVGAHG